MDKKAEEYRTYLKGKKILVVGMGRSGIAAVKVLHILGADVRAQDINSIDRIDPKFINYLESEKIGYYFASIPEQLGELDMMVLSPGVDPKLEFIKKAQALRVEIIGELELAYRIAKGRFVSITGTNGKTTTTTLVGRIFEEAGRKIAVVGNIGVAAISKAENCEEDEWMIAEASSFQLETTSQFKPVVSAILNLTPDHLNRHGNMQNYGKCKAAITKNQSSNEFLVINFDDKDCYALSENTDAKVIPFSMKENLELGAYLEGEYIVVKDEMGIVHQICSRNELKIIGDHNVQNVLAASAICFFAGIDSQTIGTAVKAFPGVEHRIEYAGMVDGVKFYNDSKGTNVDAAIIALKALKNNIILIAGGDGKSQDFTELGLNLKCRVKALVLLGRDRKQIEEAALKAGFSNIYFENDMNDCVKKALELADADDKVLLSPACASWDMYDNYEQRGDHFKQCVELLLK